MIFCRERWSLNSKLENLYSIKMLTSLSLHPLESTGLLNLVFRRETLKQTAKLWCAFQTGRDKQDVPLLEATGSSRTQSVLIYFLTF